MYNTYNIMTDSKNDSQNSIPTSKNNNEEVKTYENMSKQQLLHFIVQQDKVIKERSAQLLKVIESANNELVRAKLNNNSCDLVKKNNDICHKNVELHKKKAIIYEDSIRTQIILFVLFLLVLFWLVYHYMTKSDTATSALASASSTNTSLKN